jgi:hypothetical protein
MKTDGDGDEVPVNLSQNGLDQNAVKVNEL